MTTPGVPGAAEFWRRRQCDLETGVRETPQELCPWNVRFARELPAGTPFAPREFFAGKDALTLAHDVLAMTQEQFSAAFKVSPMKRASCKAFTPPGSFP